MLIPLSFYTDAVHGTPGQRAAFFDDVRARGILEAYDLRVFVDAVDRAIEDAEVRAEQARTEAHEAASALMSEGERAQLEVKITDAFDRLIDRNPALSDELFEACRELIEAVR
jgi:hypothetical protein